jgi:hypothetical protein
MQHRCRVGALGLVGALVFALPAAAITEGGRDFLLLAKRSVLLENGPVVINGNIGVNDPDGVLKVGAKNTINGHVVAHRIIFGTGAKVTTCEFDVSSGVNPRDVCTTMISPVNPPLPIVAWPPFPVPPVDPCVNTQPDMTVPDGTTMNLAAGCFRNLRVGDDATLTLSAGTFNVRSLRLLSGSTLGGAPSTVNVKGLTVTEGGVTIKDLTLNTGSRSAAVQIGQNSTVDNVLINAPNGGVHLHMGVVLLNGSEVVAR